MKCFQSLICPYQNLLLTADSTARCLVASFMTGSYRPGPCKNASLTLPKLFDGCRSRGLFFLNGGRFIRPLHIGPRGTCSLKLTAEQEYSDQR